jgi:hypothetical protein
VIEKIFDSYIVLCDVTVALAHHAMFMAAKYRNFATYDFIKSNRKMWCDSWNMRQGFPRMMTLHFVYDDVASNNAEHTAPLLTEEMWYTDRPAFEHAAREFQLAGGERLYPAGMFPSMSPRVAQYEKERALSYLMTGDVEQFLALPPSKLAELEISRKEIYHIAGRSCLLEVINAVHNHYRLCYCFVDMLHGAVLGGATVKIITTILDMTFFVPALKSDGTLIFNGHVIDLGTFMYDLEVFDVIAVRLFKAVKTDAEKFALCETMYEVAARFGSALIVMHITRVLAYLPGEITVIEKCKNLPNLQPDFKTYIGVCSMILRGVDPEPFGLDAVVPSTHLDTSNDCGEVPVFTGSSFARVKSEPIMGTKNESFVEQISDPQMVPISETLTAPKSDPQMVPKSDPSMRTKNVASCNAA